MKANFLLLLLAAVLITSCGDKNSFVVEGRLPSKDYDGQQVYLQEMKDDGSDPVSIDTATIADGVFSFKGIASDTPNVRLVRLADASPKISDAALFIIEPGKIEISMDSISTIKGTAKNNQLQIFFNKKASINDKLNALTKEYKSALADQKLSPEYEAELDKKFEDYMADMSKENFDFVRANMSNPVGKFFFKSLGKTFNQAHLKELLSLTDAAFRESDDVKVLEKRLAALEATAEGQRFVDLKALSPEGKEIMLSNYAGKNKIVLLDFWASWCGPCVREMPTLVKAYGLYKNKGLEIVGVSLDENKGDWTKAIKDLNITWVQMSDLKGWKSELSATYAVKSIPHVVIINQEGVIVAKNLRGEQLLSKLDELFK